MATQRQDGKASTEQDMKMSRPAS